MKRPAGGGKAGAVTERLSQSVSDPRFGEIVGRHFQAHAVAGSQAHPMLSHFTGYVREHFVFVLIERHAKHCPGQYGRNCPFYFNALFTHRIPFRWAPDAIFAFLIQLKKRPGAIT